jgi:hypothetical protein
MNYFFICPGLVLLITLFLSSPALCGDIHYAAQIDDLVEVEAVLKDDPNLVFSMDVGGRMSLCHTPLHIAAVHGLKDVAEFLLPNIADDNARNAWNAENNGRIPLHEEALKDHKDEVASILTKGGDPNAKDNNGITPLHLMAAKGYKDMAILLLNQGADVNAETSFGSTPLDMAMAIGNKEIVELFRQHGGRVGSGVLILDIESVKPPKYLSMPSPPITEKARNALFGRKSIMLLQGISRKDGTIDNIKVIKGLGYGMDEAAINTISRKWRCKPGTLNNNPIDVLITMEIQYIID